MGQNYSGKESNRSVTAGSPAVILNNEETYRRKLCVVQQSRNIEGAWISGDHEATRSDWDMFIS